MQTNNREKVSLIIMKCYKKLLAWVLVVSMSLSCFALPAYSYNIGNDYPARYRYVRIDAMADRWEFYVRECTSFVAHCLNSRNGVNFHNYYGGVHWGNARNWISAARRLGYRVDYSPQIGSIACYTGGRCGHVAWVRSVNGNYVTVEEYNWASRGNYSVRTVSKYAFSGFIHLKDIVFNKLKVSMILDGVEKTKGYAGVTFDVIVGGEKVADDVQAFGGSYRKGSSYKITDIKINGCYELKSSSVVSATLSDDSCVRIRLKTRHTYNSGVVTSTAACTADGVKTYTCLKCGVKKKKSIAAKGHQFVKKTVERACDGNSYKVSTCSNCGEKSMELVEKPAETESSGGKETESSTVKETEAVEESGQVTETEAAEESGSVDETEAVEESGSVTETEAAEESGSATETETVEASESVEESESVAETESVEESSSVSETESVAEIEQEDVNTAEPVYGPEKNSSSELSTSTKAVHVYSRYKITRRSTCEVEGSKKKTCLLCGNTIKESMPKVVSVKMTDTKLTYNGNYRMPGCVVTNANGNKLKAGRDYSISYSNNQAVGTATAKITLKGKYKGTLEKTFRILPKTGKIKSLTSGRRTLTVNLAYTAASRSGTNYIIYYRVKGSSKWFYGGNTASQTRVIKALTKGKKYEVRARVYKTVDGVRYYGNWSDVVTSGKVK